MMTLLRRLALLLFFAALPALAEQPQVTLHTDKGDIVIDLYPDKAPATVENFLQYARDGFYDGTIFHRVVPRFMIQGGGFTEELVKKPTREPIDNESGFELRNERWTVAMARTGDPDSATSQFFINLGYNPSLDYKPREPGYAVFGKVIDGRHVVREISNVETHTEAGMEDVPVEPIIIQSIDIDSGAESEP